MKSLLNSAPVFLCALALSLIFFAGCSDKINYVPVIRSIDLTPDTIAVGGTALLQIVATDGDDENLVYYYTTTGGSISGIGDTVVWQAPNQAGKYLARVLVADASGNQANDSITLVVVKNDTSTELTGVAAFPSSLNLNLENSYVRLFTSKENWINHVVFTKVKTEGFGSIVSFNFNNVPIGSYYMDIWKDTDYGNTLNAGDFYGWYGTGDILTPNPEPFTLEVGETKVLQIQMWVVPTK